MHTKATTEFYFNFLNHLKITVSTSFDSLIIKLDDISFGSYHEKALLNAMRLAFPQSNLKLCTKHLKDFRRKGTLC